MNDLLAKALWKNQPRRELFLAAAGCFAGTFLLLAAVQFHTDARSALEARNTPTIQLLDLAVSPIERSSPKRALMVLVMALITFIFTSLYVLSLEQHRRIRDMS